MQWFPLDGLTSFRNLQKFWRLYINTAHTLNTHCAAISTDNSIMMMMMTMITAWVRINVHSAAQSTSTNESNWKVTTGTWFLYTYWYLIVNNYRAHSWTCFNSSSQVRLLSAAMTKYVSSANLISLPGCIGRIGLPRWRHAAGPKPEPWTTLASNVGKFRDFSLKSRAVGSTLKKSLIQLYTASGRFTLANLCIRLLCLTVSNAFVKSRAKTHHHHHMVFLEWPKQQRHH